MAMEVKPRPTPEYYIKQPKSDILARLPGANHIILGPSKSGKSVLWQSMLLDGYKGCFSRIYLFTPSGNVDDSLEPIKKYIEKDLGHDVKSEGPYIFEELDPNVELSLETDEISVTSGEDEHLESVSIHFPDSQTGCFKWIKK